MKVLVLGGAGVFGERVARLLARDGHCLTIAGRDLQRAQAVATTIDAAAVRFDRERDAACLPQLDIEVLVDAAGPFHTYGERPHQLAEACLRAGIHYLDLADDADFCVGIGALDELARCQQRTALSGASSVPALSAAAVRALAVGLERLESIDTVILPGNRAPRGLSVMHSILDQCGRPRGIWLDGAWRRMRGWTAPRRYVLPGLGQRSGYRIGVPDLDLFPARFAARSVSFRAGLELGLMNRGLAVLARLRAGQTAPIGLHTVRMLRAAAGLLRPLGTDRGGMQVEVIGREPATAEFDCVWRRWTLLAEHGDGPWVPAMPVRALLRRGLAASGARPCLNDLELGELESAMADCRIRTLHEAGRMRALFASVPGLALTQLPATVRDSHAVFHTRVLLGEARVQRGSRWLARLLCRLFGFPRACEAIAVEVCKTREHGQERWRRRFGRHGFDSNLRIVDGRMRERFGAFEFELDLCVENAELRFPVRRGWLFGVRLPRFLLPRSDAREFEDAGRFHFDVALHAPMGVGLLVHYTGWLVAQPMQAARLATVVEPAVG